MLCTAPVASTAMCAGSPPPGMLSRVLLAGPPAILSRVCLKACLKDMLLGILHCMRQPASASLHDMACCGKACEGIGLAALQHHADPERAHELDVPAETYSRLGHQ